MQGPVALRAPRRTETINQPATKNRETIRGFFPVRVKIRETILPRIRSSVSKASKLFGTPSIDSKLLIDFDAPGYFVTSSRRESLRLFIIRKAREHSFETSIGCQTNRYLERQVIRTRKLNEASDHPMTVNEIRTEGVGIDV